MQTPCGETTGASTATLDTQTQNTQHGHYSKTVTVDDFRRNLAGRSRNACHPTPPAQIRTCATNAYGSYLECIPSNRLFGQGCTTLGCGSASRKN